MTAEQIRLYAIARIVTPGETIIRTIAEPAAGGTLYTIELKTPYKGGPEGRWFAVHSTQLRALPDGQVAAELRRAFARPAVPAQPA